VQKCAEAQSFKTDLTLCGKGAGTPRSLRPPDASIVTRWHHRDRGQESVQAKLRVVVKRILCGSTGYPPDKQKKATETVLEQTALVCDIWTVWISRKRGSGVGLWIPSSSRRRISP